MHDRAAAFAVEAVRSIVNLPPFTRLTPDAHLTLKRFAFSPDGRIVLSAGIWTGWPSRGELRARWDLATHKIIKRLSDGYRIISV